MSSEFGNKLKISVFGESHGRAIGVVINGLPAGEKIDIDELKLFMLRRRPGKNAISTTRNETDEPVFLSGINNGVLTGSPLCAIIENGDAHSSDYAAIADVPRPGHADYTAFMKWQGNADMSGGGHFSGRLTACLCIAGGIAKQLLAEKNIYVGAHVSRIGAVEDEKFPYECSEKLFRELAEKEIPVLDEAKGEEMRSEILAAAGELDSVGGSVECAVCGVEAGLGGALFSGLESRLSYAMFGIPALKGLEFGAGFAASCMRGSENNDEFTVENGKIKTATNNCGGILGGISTGADIVFNAAFKPTPSIARAQKSVSLSEMKETVLEIKGRHDPCVAVRAVPVVEAVAAAVILDTMLEEGKY